MSDTNDRSTAKNWWTFTAWTDDKRIADCGVVFSTTADDAERVARMCVGGPLASKVTRVEVGNLAQRTGLK